MAKYQKSGESTGDYEIKSAAGFHLNLQRNGTRASKQQLQETLMHISWKKRANCQLKEFNLVSHIWTVLLLKT